MPNEQERLPRAARIFQRCEASISLRRVVNLFFILSTRKITTRSSSKLQIGIWQNLNSYSQYEILELKTSPTEDVLAGWLQLAIYMKTLNSNLPNLQETPSDWLAENPQHPAATWHTASDH
ncbi:penicillin-binding protein activator [Vibrio chagasii]|nr:penicillin-binding protein activator [Vibrio chagasii]